MNKQEALNKFNEEYQQALRTQTFPQDQLPEGFDTWKHAAFQFMSVTAFQQTYGVSWMDYKVLMMKKGNFSLFEIAIICNTIEARSPSEVAQLLGEYNYYNVQDEVHKINVSWKKIVEPLKEAIQRKIEIMSNHAGAFKEGPLKFVKGNA